MGAKRGILIPADITQDCTDIVYFDDLFEPELKGSLQNFVGGWIEMVAVNGSRFGRLVVDEEGLLKNKPENARACIAAKQHIVGDAIFVTYNVSMTDLADIPDGADSRHFNAMFKKVVDKLREQLSREESDGTTSEETG